MLLELKRTVPGVGRASNYEKAASFANRSTLPVEILSLERRANVIKFLKSLQDYFDCDRGILGGAWLETFKQCGMRDIAIPQAS
ncbi:hypothetical protein CsSME_00024627 [Camellia sinensis var. sinensis]